MKKITAVILVTLSMLFSVAPIQSVTADSKEVREEFVVGPKSKGELIEVEFEPGVDPEGIITTEGISFQKVEGNKYTFIADTDIDGGKITLWKNVEKGESETEHEYGGNNQVGTPGEGEGTEISWGAFELGKHSWTLSSGEVQFAIRLDVTKYQEYEYIYVHDLPINLDNVDRFRVSKLEPNEDGIVINTGEADYEEVEVEEGFAVKIKVDKLSDGEEMRYDIVYYMDIVDNNEKFSNSYRVYTLEEWEKITSGGNAGGDVTEEEESPVIPEPTEPEEQPVITEPEEPVVPEENPDEPTEVPKEEVPKKEVPEEPEAEESTSASVEPEPIGKEEPKDVVKEDHTTEVVTDKEVLPPTGVSSSNLALAGAMIALGAVLIRKRK